MAIITQLPLSIKLPERATFANYFPGPNSEVVRYLVNSLDDKNEMSIYLWGDEGSGKTHLLQAACNYMFDSESHAAYIPLTDHTLQPDLLQELEHFSLICIDDIDTVSGNLVWEEELFHFYNRMREQGNTIIISGTRAPAALDLKIPDLESRLSWGMVFQLKTLNDEEKYKVICMRIEERGLEMSHEVAQYLMNHCVRDMRVLINLLNQLDRASLQEQRKLTIPFIKRYMYIPKSVSE